ncbi:hypothetical protein A3J23_00270 [Candidatus Peregrinibacteria bacterium RIFCSPLOWO2_02_FULL_48_14]|nr:MAG: hypothetical protein A3J23_00270 [Candidatus Peregrinibacteria bacterium RIFCSPLOWO2_02_FULL_48_14]
MALPPPNLPEITPPEPLKKVEKPEHGSGIGELTAKWGAAALAVIGSVAHLLSPEPEEPKPVSGTGSLEVSPPEGPNLVSGFENLEPLGEDTELHDTDGELKERRYSRLGDIMSSQNYGDGRTPEEHTAALIEFWEDVFRAKKGSVLYFGAKGEKLLEAEVPPNWYSSVPSGEKEKVLVTKGKGKKKVWETRDVMLKAMTEEEKNAWHNENRRAIPIPESQKHLPKKYKEVGYPFPATPVLPHVDPNNKEGESLFDLILERLNAEVVCPGQGTKEGPRHLKGEKMRLYDAIKKMSDAYDIPWAIALGLAANESGYDQFAKSDANAYGIFQIQSGAYKDARRYAGKHPEFSGKVREGALLGFNESFHGVTEWTNRLVQAEMFCAYYRLTQEQIAEKMEKLDGRLQSLDPTYVFGTLSLISTITAYNAGAGRVKRCISRFLKLEDSEIREMIGKPPYGIDVWQAVLANSFGRIRSLDKNGEEKKEAVGPAVFTYATKVLAMGSLIIEEENILEVLASSGQEDYAQKSAQKLTEAKPTEAKPTPAEEETKSKWPFVLSKYLAMGAGLVAGFQVRKDLQASEEFQEKGLKGIPRRDVVKGLAALLGLGVPAARAAISMAGPLFKKSEEEEAPPPEKPKNPNVALWLADGEKRMDSLYEELKRRGSYNRTTAENNRLPNWKTPARVAAIKGFIRRAFGTEWNGYLTSGKALPASFRETEKKDQMENLKRMLESGEAIPMEADNPELPYFCQGLGYQSGILNDKDSMFMHRDFMPVLETLVELVNHQIDIFNQNPKAFGIDDENFPLVAHISGFKVSGAFRPLENRFTGSTPSFSDHWTVLALDMISQGSSAGAALVRFKEDQYSTKAKTSKLVAEGGKLPIHSTETGDKLREILVRMTEHALFTLEDVLKTNGYVRIMPRRESAKEAWNWHLTIAPPLPPEQSPRTPRAQKD